MAAFFQQPNQQPRPSAVPKYRCSCCMALHPFGQPPNCIVHTDVYAEQRESEHRRLMQLDVIEERARPQQAWRQQGGGVGGVRKPSNPPRADVLAMQAGPVNPSQGVPLRGPSPPKTLQALRAAARQQQQQSASAQHSQAAATMRFVLIVHSAKLGPQSVSSGRQVVMQIRYGVYEGTTTVASADASAAGAPAVWQEQFAFPIEDEADLAWLSVLDAATGEELLVAELRPETFLDDSGAGGHREVIALRPPGGSSTAAGAVPEGSGGTALLSWQVLPPMADGSVGLPVANDQYDEAVDCIAGDNDGDGTAQRGVSIDQQVLEQDLMLAFSVRTVTLYNHTGPSGPSASSSGAASGGDADSQAPTDGLSSWYMSFRDSNAVKEDTVSLHATRRAVLTPTDDKCVAQVETSTRVLQVLLCCSAPTHTTPSGGDSDATAAATSVATREDELVGATAVDVAKMPQQGSARLVLYAMTADGASTAEAVAEVQLSWRIQAVGSHASRSANGITAAVSDSTGDAGLTTPTKDRLASPSARGGSNAAHTPKQPAAATHADELYPALLVKVLRGVDLRDRQQQPLAAGCVRLTRGLEESTTAMAQCPEGATAGPAAMCNVRWGDEIVFTSRALDDERKRQLDAGIVDDPEDTVGVQVLDADGRVVSAGLVALDLRSKEGMATVELFAPTDDGDGDGDGDAPASLGHVLLRYTRTDLPTVDKAVGTADEATADEQAQAVAETESPRDDAAEAPLLDTGSPRASPLAASGSRRSAVASPKSAAASPPGSPLQRATVASPTTQASVAAAGSPVRVGSVAGTPSSALPIARRIEDSFGGGEEGSPANAKGGDDDAAAADASGRMMGESSRHPDAEVELPTEAAASTGPFPRSVQATTAGDDDDAAHRQVSLQPAQPPVFRVSRTGTLRFFPPAVDPSTVDMGDRAVATTDGTTAAATADGAATLLRPPENRPLSETSLYNGIPSQWAAAGAAPGTDLPLDDAAQREADSKHLLQEVLDIDVRGGKRKARGIQRPPLRYPAPWYPPGHNAIEAHVPLDKRESQKRLVEEITVLQIVAHKVGADTSYSRSQSAAEGAAINVPMITRRPFSSRSATPTALAQQ